MNSFKPKKNNGDYYSTKVPNTFGKVWLKLWRMVLDTIQFAGQQGNNRQTRRCEEVKMEDSENVLEFESEPGLRLW